MRHDLQVALLEQLLAHVAARTTQLAGDECTVEVASYTSPERLLAEERVLFRKHPLVVGCASEVARAGDVLVHDAAGVPLVILRGDDGELRGFVNACRHRGTRLVPESCSGKKALVCRYHGWSYDLCGGLLHVPQREAFPKLVDAEAGLVRVPVAERHGLVWAVPGGRGAALDIDAWLGPVGEDLAGFGMGAHVLHRKATCRRRCNWKLVMDAFLEGYHVKSLHRDSIYRFFLEVGALFQAFGPHVRSVGARRAITELPARPRAQWDIRAAATVFYHLFPSSVLVLHPDWISHIAVLPDGTDGVRYTHHMLVPRAPETDAERAHWDKSFGLIEGRVFQTEDLEIAEAVQSTLRSGADERFRIGRLEHPIRLFHDAIERALAEHA